MQGSVGKQSEVKVGSRTVELTKTRKQSWWKKKTWTGPAMVFQPMKVEPIRVEGMTCEKQNLQMYTISTDCVKFYHK